MYCHEDDEVCDSPVVCCPDDGGGTPVQDEHPASDGEEARSDGHQSEVRYLVIFCGF